MSIFRWNETFSWAFLGAFFGTDAGGGAIELLELLAAMNYGSEIVFDETGFFAGPKTCEDENWIANTGFANGDAFLGTGDAEPIGAGFFESFGDLRAAVAVAIAFDDAQDFARSLALLAGRIHELAYGAKILSQRAERDFRPNRTSCFLAGILMCACHGPSEKFSLRHPSCAGRQPHWMPRERQHLGLMQTEGLSSGKEKWRTPPLCFL